jgi:hypothetical protein
MFQPHTQCKAAASISIGVLKNIFSLKLGFLSHNSQVEKDYIQPIKVKPLSVRSGNCWTR